MISRKLDEHLCLPPDPLQHRQSARGPAIPVPHKGQEDAGPSLCRQSHGSSKSRVRKHPDCLNI